MMAMVPLASAIAVAVLVVALQQRSMRQWADCDLVQLAVRQGCQLSGQASCDRNDVRVATHASRLEDSVHISQRGLKQPVPQRTPTAGT
jgi:hypothetical protein